MSTNTTHGTRARPFWYSVGLVVAFNSLFLALVLLKPGTSKQFMIADDVGQALGWLLATLLCFVGLERPWQRTPSRSDSVLTTRAQRWIPVLLALGIFCQFIGQVLYTYCDFNRMIDFPSLADAGYLSTFPFLLVGILLLPTRPLSGITRTRVMLDSFMTMIAVVTFSWYFVLGPTMHQGNETVFAKIVGSAYPFFDLVLIFCVLRLSFSLSDPALRPVIRLLSLGLVIIVITDMIYDYQTLQNIYANGLQDIGRPIGYVLLGLAVQALNLARVRQNVPTRAATDQEVSHDTNIAVSSGWLFLLPYALIPAVFLLAIYTWHTSWRADGIEPLLERGVYLGGIVLIGMVSLRQFFVIRETIFYNRELQRMQQELRVKNQALSEANIQLETQAAQIEGAYKQQLHLNELKDQFLLNVNHELRTPLTAIHGYLELLQEYHGQLDAIRETTFINLAVQGCEELQQLVNNVLDTLRGDFQGKEPQFEVFSVVTVVRESIDLFEPQKRQDYKIAVEIPEDLTVRADRQFVHQILLNLLSNAFKYSPKHTSIVISAQPGDFCTLDGHVHPQVCICVEDAGPGIPSSEIPLLFGKFVRLKRDVVGPVPGTGLGLYICKQLVEAMNGHIWVESQGLAGQGSRFYFTLPSVPQTLIEEQPQDRMLLTKMVSPATTSMTQDEMFFPLVVNDQPAQN